MPDFFPNATNVNTRDGVFNDVNGHQHVTYAGSQINYYYNSPDQRSSPPSMSHDPQQRNKLPVSRTTSARSRSPRQSFENAVPQLSNTDRAYWIYCKSEDSVLGVSLTTPIGLEHLVVQEKFTARQGLTDHSQMWLIEMSSGGQRCCIRNAALGNVLDVKESNTMNGAPVIVYPSTGNDNQSWTIERLRDVAGGFYYRIMNVYTRKALSLSTDTNRSVTSSSWDGRDSQCWSFEPVVFSPIYSISYAQTGWYLEYNVSKGAIASRKSARHSLQQLWFIEPATDGAYVIRSVENDSKVLDLLAHIRANGASIGAYEFNGGLNQQWNIVSADSRNNDWSSVRIINVETKTVMQAVKAASSGSLQAYKSKPDLSQTWRFEQYPLPSYIQTTSEDVDNVQEEYDDTYMEAVDLPANHDINGGDSQSVVYPNHDNNYKVRIAFKNTSDQIISVSYYDGTLEADGLGRTDTDFVVRPNHIITRKFSIEHTYNFTITKNRFGMTKAFTFGRDDTIDLDNFVN